MIWFKFGKIDMKVYGNVAMFNMFKETKFSHYEYLKVISIWPQPLANAELDHFLVQKYLLGKLLVYNEGWSVGKEIEEFLHILDMYDYIWVSPYLRRYTPTMQRKVKTLVNEGSILDF